MSLKKRTFSAEPLHVFTGSTSVLEKRESEQKGTKVPKTAQRVPKKSRTPFPSCSAYPGSVQCIPRTAVQRPAQPLSSPAHGPYRDGSHRERGPLTCQVRRGNVDRMKEEPGYSQDLDS